MSSTEEQLREYEENGFVFLQNYFSQDEVERLKAELPSIFADNTQRRVMQEGNQPASVKRVVSDFICD